VLRLCEDGSQKIPNGVRHLQRAERCPPVEGTPVALFMELIDCFVIIYVQLSGGRACYVRRTAARTAIDM